MKKKLVLSPGLPAIFAGGFLSLLGVFAATPAFAQTPTPTPTPPTPSINNVSVTEGDSGTSIASFQLDIPTEEPRDVTYYISTVNGSATANSDFQPLNNQPVIVRAGTTRSTFTVRIIGDTIYESPRVEQFAVAAASAPNGSALDTGTGTITDNDAAPTVSIDPFPPAVREGTNSNNFPVVVSLSRPAADPITVSYGVSSPGGQGFATPNSDFTIPTAPEITIPANSTTATILIPITNDLIDETPEAFYVDLSRAETPDGQSLSLTNTQAELTINDNDGPTVRVSQPVTANEGDNARFLVTLVNTGGSNTNAETITIPYRLTSGSATAGSDFDGTPGSLTILAGRTSGEILIPTTDDDSLESNETFTLRLSGGGAPNGSYFFEDSSNNFSFVDVEATIIDNDSRPVLSFTPTTAQFTEGGATQPTITVTLTGAANDPVTVSYRFVDGNGNSVAATNGSDYRGTNSTLTFPASSATTRTVTIPVTILDDSIAEGDEVFSVVLEQPVNARFVGGANTFVGTIASNDQNPDLTFSALTQDVNEGNEGASTAVRVTLNLSGASPRVVAGKYTVNPGTATSNAPADYNFDGTSSAVTTGTGNFTIPAGATSTSFVVANVIGDTRFESAENFSIVLSDVKEADLSAANTQTVNILADDAAPVVSIAPVSPSVSEGSASATYNFQVTLDRESELPVSVQYTTVDGEAKALVVAAPTPTPVPGATAAPGTTPTPAPTPSVGGGDYRSATGTLDFALNQTSRNIAITIINDSIYELDENFVVRISNPVNATLNANPSLLSATGIIANDEAIPTLSIAATSTSTQAEGTDTKDDAPRKAFNFLVSASGASALPISFNYTIDGPASFGFGDDDLVAANFGVVAPSANPGTANVVVNVVQDDIYESNESFDVRLVSSRVVVGTGSNIPVSITNRFATGTIVNDDAAPTLTLTAPTAPADEVKANVATFTLKLSKKVGRSIPISFRFITPGGDGNASPNDLTTALSGSFSFGANEDTRAIGAKAARDSVREGTESYSINVTSPIGGATPNGGLTATSTIVDEVATTATLAVAPNASANAAELISGETRNCRFRVTLAAPILRQVVLRWSVVGRGEGDTAASPSDFFETSGTVTIPAGQRTGDFQVRARPDLFDPNGKLLDEPDEGYTVSISRAPVPANGTVSPTTDYVTVPDANDSVDGVINDRTTNFVAYSPKIGFANFTPDGLEEVDGTDVTITGNQFKVGNNNRVVGVLFGVGNSANTTGTFQDQTIRYNSDDSITVRVPGRTRATLAEQARTGGIRVRIIDPTNPAKTVDLVPTQNGFVDRFAVQPTITNFTPRFGIQSVTDITVDGVNFQDRLNPITRVVVGGASTTNFTVQSDTRLVVRTPGNAGNGQLAITTEYGGTGPGSGNSYRVDTFTTGGVNVALAAGTRTGYLIEGQQGTFNSPVKKLLVRLRPAKQIIPNSEPQDIAPLAPVRVTISIASSSATSRNAIISTNYGGAVTTGTAITLFFPAGQEGLDTVVPINITDAGSDNVGAQLTANGAVLQGIRDESGYEYDVREQITPTVSVTAQIDRANNPSGAPDLYPVSTATTQGQATLARYDIHNVVTNSIFTKYETSEASDLARIAVRRLDPNKSLDPNTDVGSNNVGAPERAGNTTFFRLDLANLYAPNFGGVNGGINTDARPRVDIQLSLDSLDDTEGQLSYYVVDRNTSEVTAIQPNLQSAPLQVRFSTNPNDREYFLNQHIVLVTGIDDQLQDGDQAFRIKLFNATGNGDTEWLTTNFESQNVGFDVVNRDNEQAVDTGNTPSPGFVFTGRNGSTSNILLQTREDGSRDSFSVRLRTAPTSGRVVLVMRSSDPDEALLIAPNDGQPREQIRVFFYPNDSTSFAANESVWNRNITINVKGVDDLEFESRGSATPVNKPFQIITTVDRGLTADKTYGGIDPQDLNGQNTDNERLGFTISPSTVVVRENATSTFTVRLTSQPVEPVTLNLESNNLNAVTIQSSSVLTFTPSNWNTPQTVTVRGVSDNSPTPATRSATIVTSNAISSDDDYNDLVVPDVTVQVQNSDVSNTTPGATITPTSLNVNEGQTRTFTIQLNTQPRSDVTIPLSSSDTRIARVSVGLVTFTSANWNTPQTITVTGISDGVPTPTQRTTTIVTGAASSADSNYSGKNFSDVTAVVFNTDGATPGVRVSPTSIVADELDNAADAANTNEATFTIRLLSQPTDNVTINLFSTDTSVARVSKVNGAVASRVVFTPSNWSTQQTVTVTGVADGRLTPTRSAIISTSAAISSDEDYSGLTVPDVTVQILNTETLVRVSKQTVATSESGQTDSFTVSLASAPLENVTVTIRSDLTTEALFVSGSTRVSTLTLTFTPANWNTPQTVTVAGVRDNINDGSQAFTLSGTVTSNDSNFNGAEFPVINGTNANIDSGGSTGGTSFQPNGSYLISTPYASNNTAGTITVSQAFGSINSSSGTLYEIYEFQPTTQTGYIFNPASAALPSTDWLRLTDTSLLKRGYSYLLVTKDTTVTLRTSGFSTLATSTTTFKIALSRNRNYRSQVGTSEERNGFNAVGFPFAPTFSQVSFLDAQVQVTYTATKATTTYTVQQAASLGIINNQLFTLDGNKKITPVASGQNYLQPYQGYFVQLFDEDTNLDGTVSASERREVVLILRNPTT